MESTMKNEDIREVIKALSKEPFLGDDVIISAREDEGKADFLGEVVEEFFELYEKENKINYILWVTPPYALAFSKYGETLHPTIEDIAQVLGKGATPISISAIDQVLTELRRVKGVYVKEGGIVLAGDDIEQLITIGKIMEKAAMIYIESKGVGSVKHIPQSEAEEQHKIFNEHYLKLKEEFGNKSEENASCLSEGSEEEMELRKEMVFVGNQLVLQDLAISSWGNLSAKIDEDNMLVTPSGIPYHMLKEDDMVKVNIKTKEIIGQGNPTSELELHRKIYLAFPEAKAIVHGHGLYSSVFAGTRRGLPVMSKLMKIYINGPMPVTPYAKFGSEKLAEEAVKTLKKYEVRGTILAGHGTINYGKDLKEAIESCIETDRSSKEFLDRKKGIF